jgi:RNA polymerase sigma-70 factor (ECF subfamily)
MDQLDQRFRTFHEPSRRYLTRRLGDRDAAEKLAQKTFVRAMRDWPVQRERAWRFAVATADRVRDQALARAGLDALAERDRLALLKREEGLGYHSCVQAAG